MKTQPYETPGKEELLSWMVVKKWGLNNSARELDQLQVW